MKVSDCSFSYKLKYVKFKGKNTRQLHTLINLFLYRVKGRSVFSFLSFLVRNVCGTGSRKGCLIHFLLKQKGTLIVLRLIYGQK